ncbi:DNA/RNA polymerases superfamily protein [Gossypium australe]|uniref:DNA/RNA polymerases superfamily protein n=1 Tax=Gossypium australe TaxID=47621 RepID=A0A5B6WRM6_9ROSI|nr:DNA/RNA polymerases superfamily protein [Gossypium australe]
MDASLNGLGCVLMQKGKVTAYASRQLKPHKKNYPTHDLELAAVRRWIELLKDYDLAIEYHPDKANVVVDTLSRKTLSTLASLRARMCLADDGSIFTELRERMKSDDVRNFSLGNEGELRFIRRLYVPNKEDLRVKVEHQVPLGKLCSLEISEWKWDRIMMYFLSGLLLNASKKNSVWKIMDRLSKSAHFVAMCMNYSLEKLVKLYISEIVCKHGIPCWIVSKRDLRFTSRFWKQLQTYLGTKLRFNIAFHPQTDGQSERVIQVLEDMLRSCVIEFGMNWEKYLPLAEFAYSNSYHASLGMSPFEVLYGRNCRSLIC